MNAYRRQMDQAAHWLFNDFPEGLQRQGYWYENTDQVARQAHFLAERVLHPAHNAYHHLFTVIYDSIMADNTRSWYNEPFFVVELYKAALNREADFVEAFEDYNLGAEEYQAAANL